MRSIRVSSRRSRCSLAGPPIWPEAVRQIRETEHPKIQSASSSHRSGSGLCGMRPWGWFQKADKRPHRRLGTSHVGGPDMAAPTAAALLLPLPTRHGLCSRGCLGEPNAPGQ